MAVMTLFASTQACPPALNLVLTMRARGHRLRTLGQLPPPRPCRVASLRLELFGLLQDARTIRWTLSQYAQGLRLPDAYRQACLQADLDVVEWRLGAVRAALHSVALPEALA